MNKLEELIARYCPNSVEYKALGEVCDILRGKRLTKAQLSDEGKYPVLHGGSFPMGYYDEFNRKAGTTVVVNTGNAGSVFYYDKEFWSSDACFALYPYAGLSDKYLYYYMSMCEPILKVKVRSGAMPTIDSIVIKKLIIPVPPLEVQNEIAGILDNLTEFTVKLKTELTTEFAARKQQYEYYRDKLLAFEDNSAVQVDWIPLSKVAKVSRGVRVLKKDLPEKGVYPVYQDSLMPMGYYNYYNGKANTTFMIGAGSAGEIGYSTINFWAADDCFIFDCEDCLLDRFLYYILMSKQVYIFSRVRKASIPRLARDVVEKLIIPIPPIKVQKQIVNLLDNFNAFYSDLSAGLSSEIEARQKQYEYYRDKLLTFKEKEINKGGN